jgi:hypothetical protein
MANKELCDRDLSILDLIFDQKQCEKDVKDFTRPVIDEIDAKDEDEGNSVETLRSKALEVEGVKLAEAGKLEEALEKLNESIEKAKDRPSPFNNRAQLYRFLEKDDCRKFFAFRQNFDSIFNFSGNC